MPQRNRVTPTSEIVAIPLRGAFMGNRGCLHEGRAIVRAWKVRYWIVCQPDFRGRRVVQWNPGRYTVLFFHDEAVALAAGHRPCAECRNRSYRDWCDAWAESTGGRERAAEMDRRLHGERLDGTRQRRHSLPWAEVPDGAFVHHGGRPALVLGDALVGWTVAGYGGTDPRPAGGGATVLTPPATLGVLRAGYGPLIAPEALALAALPSIDQFDCRG